MILITLGVLLALNWPEPPLCSGGSLGGGGGMCSSADGRGMDAWVLRCKGKQGLCTSGHRDMQPAPTRARQNLISPDAEEGTCQAVPAAGLKARRHGGLRARQSQRQPREE